MSFTLTRSLIVVFMSFTMIACNNSDSTDSGTTETSYSYDSGAVFIAQSENSFVVSVDRQDERELDASDVEIKQLSGPLLNPGMTVQDNNILMTATPESVNLSQQARFSISLHAGDTSYSEELSVFVVNREQVKPVAVFNYDQVDPQIQHYCAPQETVGSEPGTKVAFQRIYEDIEIPGVSAMRQPAGDDTYWYVLFYVEQKLKRFRADGKDPVLEEVADFTPVAGNPFGFAFHPDFVSNGKIYVHTYLGTISEYTWSEELGQFDPDSHKIILQSTGPEGIKFDHTGGNMHFGPDGYLYVAFGDFTSPDFFNTVSQDTDTFAGKMLRIDVDGPPPYSIPADNPFKGQEGEEIYALGFRHPWKWSFDRLTGDIWVGDVGSATKEEINIVSAGGNYGWPIFEGKELCLLCPQIGWGLGYNRDAMISPVHEYGREVGAQISVTGGFVYRGQDVPSMFGKYIYGDFSTGKIWSLTKNGEDYNNELIDEKPIGLATFSEDNQGEIYALDLYEGGIYKLVSQASATESVFPEKLSETGCVDVLSPLTPPAGAVPFDVQVPLWSDSAVKTRWLFLPRDQKISLLDTADGDLDFPPNTVLVKHFSILGNLVETRLFTLLDNGEWLGYSYEWNDAQSEAYLLEEDKEKVVGGQTWSFPSRSQCLQCHTEAAGRALGPTIAQWNIFFQDLDKVVSQMAEIKNLGVFDFKPDLAMQFSHPENSVIGVADKARAYLDSNCSGCHRPEGAAGRADIDLRASVPLAETNLCNVIPRVDSVGIEDAKLIVPGDADKSVLLARMNIRGTFQMPVIGSNEVDEENIFLVRSWIESLSSCEE